MKINLGCGGIHKSGYLNVDAFDETIADEIMSAVDLNLEENSVDEVLISQVIEHLGIGQSLYALSECFRVLKPQGKLIIETPDIRRSFQKYLKGNRETRKNIFPWIYGVDMPGMQHRFCFPDDLLEEILRDNGFVDIKKEFVEFDEYQPILRIVCRKTSDYQSFQIISKFRKKLLKKSLIDLDDQIPTLEKEELINFFTKKIDGFLNTKKEDIIDEITIEGAVRSPKMTYEFLEELVQQKVRSSKILEHHIKTLSLLIKLHFMDILVNRLKELPGFIGEQEKLLASVENFGKNKVKQLLSYSENMRKAAINDLSTMSKTITSSVNIDFFSEKLIMLQANRLFQKGAKEFNLSSYKMAIKYFENSANLYRDQILTYWNLGRLYVLQNNREMGMSHYKNALKLLKIIYYKNKISIKNTIEKEIKEPSLKKIKNPVYSTYLI